MNPVVYEVFNTWELVDKIFSYLTWDQIFQLCCFTEETLAYFRSHITEIDFKPSYSLTDDDYHDVFKLLGKNGCENLTSIDFSQSPTLTHKVGPIIKHCKNLQKLACSKWKKNSTFYFHLLYNQGIVEFKINSLTPNFVQDCDVMELHLLLPNLERLEIPATEITNVSLLETCEWNETLKYLNISSCQKITDFGLRHVFRKCTQLKRIDVSNTPTLGESYDDISENLESLVYLNARGTNITTQGARFLRSWFQSKSVEYEFLHDSNLAPQSSVDEIIRQRIRQEFERYYGINDDISVSSEDESDSFESDIDDDDDDDDDDEDFVRAVEISDGALRRPRATMLIQRWRTLDPLEEVEIMIHNFGNENKQFQHDCDEFQSEETDYNFYADTKYPSINMSHGVVGHHDVAARDCRIELNHEIQQVWSSINRAEDNLRCIQHHYNNLVDLVIQNDCSFI